MTVQSKLQHAARLVGLHVERHPPRSGIFGHVGHLLRRYEVDCVIDVGANVGQYGSGLRATGYAGRIVSIEPVPEAHAELVRRTAKDVLWETKQLALADEPGTRTLHVTRDTAGSSFAKPVSAAPGSWASVVRTVDVDVARLDDLSSTVPDGSTGVYLKVDAQGADLAVLRGARSMLERVEGLQIEVSVQPLYDERVDYLDALAEVQSYGFALSGFFPNVENGRLQVIEADAVFVRP